MHCSQNKRLTSTVKFTIDGPISKNHRQVMTSTSTNSKSEYQSPFPESFPKFYALKYYGPSTVHASTRISFTFFFFVLQTFWLSGDRHVAPAWTGCMGHLSSGMGSSQLMHMSKARHICVSESCRHKSRQHSLPLLGYCIHH